MKRKITLLLIGSFVFCLFFAGGYDKEDGKAGATGSPGETTCNTTNCHTGFVNNSQGGSVSIASDIPGWEYTPGETYTIMVTVTESDVGLFGLGFEALKPDGSNAGTLVPGVGTQTKNQTISGDSRKSIVHLEDAGLSSDSHTFEFTWNAPANADGDITFYVAGNAANNNGLKSGDHIYTSSQVVTQGPVRVEEMNAIPVFEIFCNPTAQSLNMNYSLVNASLLEVKLYALDGKELAVLMNENTEAGIVDRTFSIAEINHGSYIVSVSVNGNPVHFHKFVY